MTALTKTKVLLVEDNLADARYVEEMLPPANYTVNHVISIAAARESLADNGIAVVLLDLSLPDTQGLQTCLAMLELAPDTPIVVLTGLEDEQMALDAVRQGAQDYIHKNEISESSLSRAIRYALERKRAEEEVRQSASRARQAETLAREVASNLNLALSASKTGTWSWDIATDTLTTDEQLAAMFGTAPGTFGNSVQDFVQRVHEEDRAYVNEAVQASIQQGASIDVEYRVPWPDGSIHYIAGRGQPIRDSSGLQVRITGISTDITRLKEEQENAERLLLLEQHEDFVATLSHDLKNPLISANRVLEMLSAGRFGQLEEGQKKPIMLLRQSNADMLSLIYNLLDVYRFDQGQPPVDFIRLDVATAAQACLNQFHEVAADKGVELRCDFPGEDHKISADEIALRRILMNLVGNAIKFTGPGGVIVVSGSNQDKTYTLEIADNGSGISEEDVAKLFQRYIRTGTGKKHTSGTGLGLYLCRQLVEAHGGEISCWSIPKQKTVFTVVLPSNH